jgi:hypothetical protein
MKLSLVAAICAGAWLSSQLESAVHSSYTTGGCLGPDSYTMYELAYLRPSLASPDSSLMRWRLKAGLPTLIDSTLIVAVTDSVTCARASDAFRQSESLSLDSLPLAYVIQAGSHLIVSHPSHAAGEFTVHVVLDSLFQHRGKYVK